MTYKSINLMVPTYKRPEWIQRFVHSALRTATDVSNLRFTFCVNKEDAETKDILANMYWPHKLYWEIIEEETQQPNLSLYFNMMYENTVFDSEDTLISMVGDDMVFVTQGWDTMVLEELNRADGKAVVYLDDDYISHDQLAVNLFTSRDKMVESTGLPFMCPLFHAEMIDTVWTAVGRITETLCYKGDYILRHEHSTKDSAEKWDETFQRLSRVQKATHAQKPVPLAIAYATRYAAKLIEAGVGTWNVLPTS